MKFLILLILSTGISHAETFDASEDIEVGSPRDCVVVGKTNDSKIADDLNQVQQQIIDCLAPQEEEAKSPVEKNHHQVVSQ